MVAGRSQLGEVRSRGVPCPPSVSPVEVFLLLFLVHVAPFLGKGILDRGYYISDDGQSSSYAQEQREHVSAEKLSEQIDIIDGLTQKDSTIQIFPQEGLS